MPAMKTLDEHRTYLYEIVHLKLWFLWHWLREHPDEPFEKVLRERVDIYRKLDLNPEGINPRTCHWDDPHWLELEARARQVYLAHREDDSAATFEEEAFAVFRPQIDARAPRDFTDRSALEDYTYGSIRFDLRGEAHPGFIDIHIANTVAPRSIFTDPAYLPDCLREVMRRAEASGGVEAMETFTWLNSVPGWLALFPAEWQEHLSPPDLEIIWHYGYWGQFITSRGAFHIRRAQQFRDTGVLPYPPRASWCSFASLQAHLDSLAAVLG